MSSPPLLEAFCCSGNSPTVHLLGAGSVGQALLRQLAALPVRVVAVSDSTATAHDRNGLPCLELADFKALGGSLATRSRAESLPLPLALDLVGADIVVDATPSHPAQAESEPPPLPSDPPARPTTRASGQGRPRPRT